MTNLTYDKLGGVLAIVSSAFEGKPAGCVVNSVMQVAGGKLAISISKDNFTCGIIEKSGVFTVALLTESVGKQVLADFGFKSSAQINKFASFPSVKDKNGVPTLTQDIAARFACSVVDTLDLGTHMLYVGNVREAENGLNSPVLTTAQYRAVKEGQIPQNAPAHSTGEPGWRCTICGYILEDETIPDDFKCPICGRGPNMLVKR